MKDALDDFERVHEKDKSRAPTPARIAQGTVLVTGGGNGTPCIHCGLF